MNDWKKYPRNRKMREEDGFLLIVPEDFGEKSSKTMPMFCDVCELAFSRPDDKTSFDRFFCCSTCADTWAYSRQKDWENGWRPTPEAISVAVGRRILANPIIRFE
jgi:hypothetical protein